MSVPSSELGPPHPLSRKQRGRGTHPAGEGWGSPSSDDWRKSLAFCLLCGSILCRNKLLRYVATCELYFVTSIFRYLIVYLTPYTDLCSFALSVLFLGHLYSTYMLNFVTIGILNSINVITKTVEQYIYVCISWMLSPPEWKIRACQRYCMLSSTEHLHRIVYVIFPLLSPQNCCNSLRQIYVVPKRPVVRKTNS